MLLDFSSLSAREAYGWMVSAITPRPIAWVSTVSLDGNPNLAPFSFFQGITANPPTLMFVPVNTRDGGKKDTLRNIEQVPQFVVNIVSYALAEKMNATAGLYPYGVSEFEKCGVTSAPSHRVKPARVAESPIAFECRLDRIVSIGEGPIAANVIFGRILLVHVAERILNAEGEIDSAKLDAIGRLGGEAFSRTTETFSLKRPDR